jgi:hypothetical protein
MSKDRMLDEHQGVRQQKREDRERDKEHPAGPEATRKGWTGLQKLLGNRAVQRLLGRQPQGAVAQRSGEGPVELDEDTAGRINRERGSGQPLDATVQEQAGAAMGHDFQGVRVHTSPEADDLNRQLGAKAFTTGQDVFFREGAYDPHSTGGQELITHELTHVAQQGTGAVRSGGRMAVNPPGDSFEQEADATAKALSSQGAATQVQRISDAEAEEEDVQAQAEPEEEEEEVQAQAEEEEEEVQTQAEPEEEEEEVQAQAEPEEEEEAVQAQDEREEELP